MVLFDLRTSKLYVLIFISSGESLDYLFITVLGASRTLDKIMQASFNQVQVQNICSTTPVPSFVTPENFITSHSEFASYRILHQENVTP